MAEKDRTYVRAAGVSDQGMVTPYGANETTRQPGNRAQRRAMAKAARKREVEKRKNN